MTMLAKVGIYIALRLGLSCCDGCDTSHHRACPIRAQKSRAQRSSSRKREDGRTIPTTQISKLSFSLHSFMNLNR